MSTTTPAVMVAKIVPLNTSRRATDRLVIVSDPKIGDVRVRWDLLRAQCWRCEVCGPQRAVVCAHTFSAGLLLAESLLGLTRALEFHPDDDPRRDTATTHNEGQLIHD